MDPREALAYDAVDADALRALTRPTPPGPSMDEVAVSVTYDGHDVTVSAEGVVAVRPPEASTA